MAGAAVQETCLHLSRADTSDAAHLGGSLTTVAHGKIVAIDLVADPDRRRQLDLAILDA